jgi:DNA/RNA endonuclease YhcR with UshA esterase domain
MITSLRKNLKFILPAVILIMLIGLILSRVYQPEPGIPTPEITISAEEAQNHIGKAGEVCGSVADVRFLPQINGQPTFINFGEPDPNQHFTVVIWGENRAKWEQFPENIYPGKYVCVTGIIETHGGTPQIEARIPKQIQRSKSNS